MKTNKFAGKDPCRWQAVEVSKTQGEGAQAWHQYRYASGTSPAQAPFSPWDEAAADAVEAAINLPHVADILVPDANLNAPFTREELCSNLRRLLSDKATGPDGITNRMIQLGGIQFQTLLFSHLSDVWRESIDPPSYRGIFLSNATLKLFEGILESRLKEFTETFDTLTPSQQGSRPDRQRHDTIYSLLATVQQQKQSPQRSTQGVSPSLGIILRVCGLYNGVSVSPQCTTANDSKRQQDHGEDVGDVKTNVHELAERRKARAQTGQSWEGLY